MKVPSTLATALLSATLLAQPLVAAEDITASEGWQFGARIYAWLPDVEGSINYPIPGAGGGDISVSASDILDKLEMTFMGSFLARNGRLSLFTDLIYLDLADKSRSTIETPGPGEGLKARADMSMESLIWTGGVGYTLVSSERGNFDLHLGFRMLDMDSEVELSLTGDLLPIDEGAKLQVSETLWDGVVGVKGRINLGENWFIPYYADIGTGDSDSTWQAMTGIGFGLSWGAVTLTYRQLEYDQGSRKPLEDISFAGPAVGVNFRW